MRTWPDGFARSALRIQPVQHPGKLGEGALLPGASSAASLLYLAPHSSTGIPFRYVAMGTERTCGSGGPLPPQRLRPHERQVGSPRLPLHEHAGGAHPGPVRLRRSGMRVSAHEGPELRFVLPGREGVELEPEQIHPEGVADRARCGVDLAHDLLSVAQNPGSCRSERRAKREVNATHAWSGGIASSDFQGCGGGNTVLLAIGRPAVSACGPS
jgi:hypothetical protein